MTLLVRNALRFWKNCSWVQRENGFWILNRFTLCRSQIQLRKLLSSGLLAFETRYLRVIKLLFGYQLQILSTNIASIWKLPENIYFFFSLPFFLLFQRASLIFERTVWHSLTISMANWQSLPSKKAQTSEVIEITSFLGGSNWLSCFHQICILSNPWFSHIYQSGTCNLIPSQEELVFRR